VEEAEGVEAEGLDAGAGVTAGVEEAGAAIGAGAGNPTCPFFSMPSGSFRDPRHCWLHDEFVSGYWLKKKNTG
jgi:hypothetical protein